MFCETCNCARFTDWMLPSEGLPTHCPESVEHTSIRGVSISKISDKGVYKGDSEDTYATTNPNDVDHVAVVVPSLPVGTVFFVEWYGELYRSNNAGDAEVTVVVSGSITGTVVLGEGVSAKDIGVWTPVSGRQEYTVENEEELTFSLRFKSTSAGKEVKVRRARLWATEQGE